MTAYQRAYESEARANISSRPRRTLHTQTLRLCLYISFMALDVATLLLGPLATYGAMSLFGAERGSLVPSFALIPIFLVLAINRGLYSIEMLRRPTDAVRHANITFALAVFALLMIAFFMKSAEPMSRLTLGLGAVTSAVLLTLLRLAIGLRVKQALRGRIVKELLILDGVTLSMPYGDAHVLDTGKFLLQPDLNNPAMLHRFGMIAKGFDRVIVHSTPDRQADWALVLKGADVDGEILMDERNAMGAVGLRNFHGKETMLVSRAPLSLPNRMKKRALDLAVTIPLLIAISPLLGLVALIIKLDSRGPVLFRQDRVGRGNRQFKVLKFRSMRVEQSDAQGNRSASRDDDRITRVGRVIRATSIDELPQLINVLLGDMSLVGPRPHALGSLVGKQLFWEVDRTYWHRHTLKPGITGLAQVRGFRGATVEMSDLTNRLQADMEYVQGWDLWRDIGILLRTVGVVVHRNAY